MGEGGKEEGGRGIQGGREVMEEEEEVEEVEEGGGGEEGEEERGDMDDTLSQAYDFD